MNVIYNIHGILFYIFNLLTVVLLLQTILVIQPVQAATGYFYRNKGKCHDASAYNNIPAGNGSKIMNINECETAAKVLRIQLGMIAGDVKVQKIPAYRYKPGGCKF